MDISLLEQFDTPKGKIRALAQFNKISGALVSIMQYVDPERLSHEYFLYKEIEFDFENDILVGTYSDFKIIPKDQAPIVITEPSLDAMARDKITKRYPVIQQVNILGRAIMKLSEHLGIEQDEMEEMLDYIAEVKHANKLRKEYYQENPNYEYKSQADLDAEEAARLEGGLHEAYGPRPTEGGRVF